MLSTEGSNWQPIGGLFLQPGAEAEPQPPRELMYCRMKTNSFYLKPEIVNCISSGRKKRAI